jgi:hypothetical protein
LNIALIVIIVVIAVAVVAIASIQIYQFLQAQEDRKALELAAQKYNEYQKYPYKGCDTTSTPGLALC